MPGFNTTPRVVSHLDVRGGDLDDLNRLLSAGPVVTLTGSRASTPYGDEVTGQMAYHLARAGVTLLVGGSYGIEGRALRTYTAFGGRAVIIQAGGLARVQPPGNTDVFAAVLECGGVIASLDDPDVLMSRSTVNARNGLIAALTGALVVVEASTRSTALMMAADVHADGRPVFAVPGPVTSASSIGTHELIRRREAELITDVNEMGDLTAMRARTVRVA